MNNSFHTRNSIEKIINTKGFVILVVGILLWSIWPVRVHAQQVNSDNISVIFVIDDSGSMETNDPNDLRVTAVKLFIALLDIEDGAAVITFSDESEIKSHYTEILGYSEKETLINSIGDIQSQGYTNMKAAFENVRTVLQEDNTGNRQIVIFLTDGSPELEEGVTPDYKQETLNLVEQSQSPVLAIGLTTSSLDTFLGQITNAAGESSQIIPVDNANDLLDVYLGILGQLKDRTIIGEGEISSPGNAELPINPALTQYIDSASFVAILPSNGSAELFAPGGTQINSEDVVFSETFTDTDPNFVMLTIPKPSGGDWRMQFQGNGIAQARAILRSRLRVKVLQPGSFSPAGDPMPIIANLIIEDPGLAPKKSIGETYFTALIERPDGSRDSIDLLFDNGTHGDLLADDGDFSNTYVNTDLPGTYSIMITGHKSNVPVSTRVQTEVIEFPKIVVDSPVDQQYEIRNNPIDLYIHLEGDGLDTAFEGDFVANIVSPSGKTADIPMTKTNGTYMGSFVPQENGNYQVSYVPIDGFYLGQTYQYTASASFDALTIPNLRVQRIDFGLGASTGKQYFELYEAKQGIPMVVTIESGSDQVQEIQANLEQIPGFDLAEKGPFTIAPLGTTTLTLHLVADEQIEFGSWDGNLILTPSGQVDLVNDRPPINFEIYQPAISITPQVISQVSGDSCLNWGPVTLLLTMNSSSIQQENINLHLAELDGMGLNQTVIEVPPGRSEQEVLIVPEENLSSGEYEGLLLISSREGVGINPAENQTIVFSVDPIWVTCRRPMIFIGVGLALFVIVIVSFIRGCIRKVQPAIVRGWLNYWTIHTPQAETSVDISKYNAQEISIGSSHDCNIVITDDEDIQEIHARIIAEKIDDNESRILLEPVGQIRIGYRQINQQVELEEGVEYTMGNHIFKFLHDPFQR